MRLNFKSMGMMIALAGMTILPMTKARADEWNQETKITLDQPLEVPGQVLPAGNYVFQLADSQTDRNIVQIFNEDKTHLVTTVTTIPAYRLEPTGDTKITVREAPDGTNQEAISTWFFAGETSGVHFIYPNEQ